MLDPVLKQKDAELINASIELKKKFVGIDPVIDQFINSVRIWYLMPELMTRPVIVNLWGLTGSGKTDLVRTFIRLIQMLDSFIELQMDTTSCYSSIQSFIEYADIQTDKPSILLLDEIQRFRTINEKGEDIATKSLQDVWMLLSDGKFQSESDKKKEIMEIVFEDLFYHHNEEEKDENILTTPDEKEEKKEKTKRFKYKNSHRQAQRLKKLLNYQASVEDIMKWDYETKLKKAKEALADNSTYEGKTYSKMLIVVAGNIDDAYKMSGEVENADTDADIFHEFSKKINVVSIKAALSKRFKPEQVARFGNNHIIYPSLSKSNYQDIIKQNVRNIINRVKDIHHIEIIIDDSVYSTIYSNGVYPAQGVRPVISTISSVFENYIPVFLFKAIEKEINVVMVSYSKEEIIGVVGNETVSCKVELAIDKIKKAKNINETVLTSIHEAGHILVYVLFNKIPPTQMKSLTSNLDSEGFIGLHDYRANKKLIREELAIGLAGQAAEEIFFGDDFKSTGASGDIIRVTTIAAMFVRAYGFDGIQSRVRTEPQGDAWNLDIGPTSVIIENMLKEAKKLAIDFINQHHSLFKDIANTLIDKGDILPKELVQIFKKHNEEIVDVPINSKIVHNYKEKWEKHLEKQNV